MRSSWCKSSPAKAAAGRPVASVAIRWVTDGCEAYTASKQAVRIQLRNRFVVAVPTPLAWRKAASDPPPCEVDSGPPESLARGMLTKGFPVNPGELSTSRDRWVWWHPTQRHPVPGGRGRPPRRANKPSPLEKPAAKGNRRCRPRVEEQSYAPIVPMKVGNRRAPARGGHGTHWREGANRSMHRRSATGTRPGTREGR
jgi:hypothetical protein